VREARSSTPRWKPLAIHASRRTSHRCVSFLTSAVRMNRMEATGRRLAAMAGPLVGDVADVVRIETLRSTPLIVDRPTKAKPALDRTFSLRPGLIESSPAELLPESAHRVCPRLSDCINHFRHLPSISAGVCNTGSGMALLPVDL
jgi:hypothetical protein